MKINCKGMTGPVKVICSKSQAHRYMVCSFLADRIENIRSIEKLTGPLSEDLCATWGCLTALAAPTARTILPCCESGTTLRLLMPIVTALGIPAVFELEGSLAARPNTVLEKELERHGAIICDNGSNIEISGKIEAGEYRLPGNISSQYISGLLLALPLLDGDSIIIIDGRPQSMPYIEMTLNAMKIFGVSVETTIATETSTFAVKGRQKYKYSDISTSIIEGDWSSGAMWLAADSLLGGRLDVQGLNSRSMQGDRAIVEIINKLESAEGDTVTIDARDIPDIIPAVVLRAVASNATTEIINAERLRLKECDRLEAIYDIITELGADIDKTENGLIINGTASVNCSHSDAAATILPGTTEIIDTRGDHRMVMMAALASIITDKPVIIDRPEAVAKSYPKFWEDIKMLGGIIE